MKIRVVRQAYYTDCDHEDPRRCRALTDGTGGNPQHRYFMWHLEGPDGPTDDGPWYSAREARNFLRRISHALGGPANV